MTARLTILASGSAGNSALVEIGECRLLIDCGLEPTALASRLTQQGLSWSDLSGVLITHRHTDHWRPATLLKIAEHRVPIHAHRDHVPAFRVACRNFEDIERSRLVKPYVTHRPMACAEGWQCRPFRVRHDGGATFGFRFDAERLAHDSGHLTVAPSERGSATSFAYVADLGCWDDAVIPWLSDVELLALEFNHDPAMLKASNRPPWLIRRVLSDDGHLSNAQAAALLRQTLKVSSSGRLQQLVLLHMSRECNTADLATAAAQAVLAEQNSSAGICVAEQSQPTPTFVVGERLEAPARAAATQQQLALFSVDSLAAR